MGPDNRLEHNKTMPKVNILKDAGRIKSTDIIYMKRFEEQNLERAKAVQGYRKANNRMAFGLTLLVIGIYSYTIYSVKQEKFLDNFEMPEKTIEKTA